MVKRDGATPEMRNRASPRQIKPRMLHRTAALSARCITSAHSQRVTSSQPGSGIASQHCAELISSAQRLRQRSRAQSAPSASPSGQARPCACRPTTLQQRSSIQQSTTICTLARAGRGCAGTAGCRSWTHTLAKPTGVGQRINKSLYRVPTSARMVTMVWPGPSSCATRMAPATLIIEELPARPRTTSG
jgi:hypothetical protein